MISKVNCKRRLLVLEDLELGNLQYIPNPRSSGRKRGMPRVLRGFEIYISLMGIFVVSKICIKTEWHGIRTVPAYISGFTWEYIFEADTIHIHSSWGEGHDLLLLCKVRTDQTRIIQRIVFLDTED